MNKLGALIKMRQSSSTIQTRTENSWGRKKYQRRGDTAKTRW